MVFTADITLLTCILPVVRVSIYLVIIMPCSSASQVRDLPVRGVCALVLLSFMIKHSGRSSSHYTTGQ
jgi:hypothetical protein